MHRIDSNMETSDDIPYYGTVIYSKLLLQNVRKLCLCGLFIYCPPKLALMSNFQSFMTSLISWGLLDVKKNFCSDGRYKY